MKRRKSSQFFSFFFEQVLMQFTIKLSENPTRIQIEAFIHATKGQVLELRNKFGMLIALGTSLTAFHDIKDRNGTKMYNVEYKQKLNYDTMNTWVHQDCVISTYKPRTSFSTTNEKVLKVMQNSETYWARIYQDYLNSSSPKKDYPNLILNRVDWKNENHFQNR